MAIRKNRQGMVTVENASVGLLKDAATCLNLVEALNDIQRSLARKEYTMVLLSMGPKGKTPQISYKDSEGDWNFIPASSLLTALIKYGELLTEFEKLD